MRFCYFTISLLLLNASLSTGQPHAWSMRHYSAVDGLPQSQVNMILEDSNGYLWIATHGGGLARFDGRSFRVYTTLDGMLSNIVTYLKLDANQNLWVVHPRGISRFDGVRFKHFVQPGSPVNARRIRQVFEVADTLFLLTSPGHLGKIYGDSVYYWAEPQEDGNRISYCHRMPDGRTLLYMNDSTFCVLGPAGAVRLSHRGVFNGLKAVFNYNDHVWLRTDKGAFTLDLARKSFMPAVLPVRNHIVHIDERNEVFWTRRGNILMKERLIDGRVSADTILRDVEITQVLTDSEGNTWFATHGRGLYKYYIRDFDKVTPDDVGVVMAVHRDREGTTWVGSTTKGLWRFTNEGARRYYDKNDSFRNMINGIAEAPDGTIWVASGAGLGKYDPVRDGFQWFTRAHGLTSAMVVNLAFDPTGRLYAGTFNGGLNVFDGKAFSAITVEDGLTAPGVQSLHYSNYYDRLFAGSEFGVSAIADGNVEPLFIPEIANAGVLSLHPYADSLLLIGTGGAGVVIYNPESRVRKMLTTRDGLASDFIYFVGADQNQYLWVGSEKGITRLKLDDGLTIVEILHYDHDNGLAGVETNQNAFYLGKDVKLFGLIDGLYRFNQHKRDDFRSFDLHLTAVDLFYGEYDARRYARSVFGFFRLPWGLSLPPDINHITFRYNRVDKRHPKSVKFRYFLENFDKTWSLPASHPEVTYSNLPPGDYVFRVRATDSHGSWSAEKIRYPFTVSAPFYQTASFLVGAFILVAALVTLVMYWRVKRRIDKMLMTERIRSREQETLRKEIARDFHDEMGNQLTRIINYVSLMKLGGNNGHRADLYAKVEDSAKYLYTGTRDFIWSIDPVNDELSRLFLHIRDFGEKLFEEKNIDFRAFNEIKEPSKLPYGFSRQANLIFKEAMTNAFKYSRAQNVTLALRRDDAAFELFLEDDGIGFYPGEIEKSNGLKNIRERADRIQSILRIQSMPGKGTRVMLRFKLNKTLKYGLTI